ncbi:MAG TPA: efflux RND transporter periplasmic adaptor subunit [Thermoanaerobaculia bacterium]|jgi:membrane fusion protein (multidrug efflux system)|nr:efflux RND transporter periplasmic adaptor subunit [Thermoanaerobaculia bacterium]
MKRELFFGTALMAAGLALYGCGGKKDEPAPPPPPAAVVVAPVVQRDVPVYREWIGTTDGNVNAEIRPKVDGYLLRRVYTEGSFVRQGQLLFEIDPRQSQAQLEQVQADLEQAKAQLAKTHQDVVRFQPLVAQKAISQQELDNALSAERAAKAAVDARQAAVHEARLTSGWARVTSPISGIAGIAQQQVGNLVSPTTVLTTVSQVDPIRVLYPLSEQEYLHYQEKLQKDPRAAQANDLELVLADGSVFPHKGRVLFEGRQVDVKTGTISTVALFPNPGNLLRPGQYAKVRAVTELKKGAILVPQRAVNELQGAYQVAVVGGDDKAEIRTVQAGERVGKLWVIDSGLQPGDRVVVEGFTRVKSGAKVNPKEAPPEVAAGGPEATPATTPGTPATGGR